MKTKIFKLGTEKDIDVLNNFLDSLEESTVEISEELKIAVVSYKEVFVDPTEEHITRIPYWPDGWGFSTI